MTDETVKAIESKLVQEIIHVRKAQGISQRKLGEMTEIRQSVIARLETGKTSPTLETMMKLLVPLGKTLKIADFTPEQSPAQAPVQEFQHAR